MDNYVTIYNSLNLLYSIDSTFTNQGGKMKLSIKVALIGWNPSACIKLPMCLKLLRKIIFSTH